MRLFLATGCLCGVKKMALHCRHDAVDALSVGMLAYFAATRITLSSTSECRFFMSSLTLNMQSFESRASVESVRYT